MASYYVVTIFKLLVIFILCCNSFYVSALTPAGTRITHQSQITYFDPESGTNISVISNFSTITVARVYDFELITDFSDVEDENSQRLAAAGTTINIPITIRNTSNTKDSYKVNVINSPGDNGDIYSFNSGEVKIYNDFDGNGILDAGENELKKDSDGNYITSILGVDEITALLYVISIPSHAVEGDFYNLSGNIVSLGNNNKSEFSNIKVVVVDGSVINLTIHNNPICSQHVGPLGDMEYIVHYNSIGNKLPDVSSDGYLVFTKNEAGQLLSSYVTGVLITVTLPANVRLKQDKLNDDGTPLRDHAPINFTMPNSNGVFNGGLVVVGINNTFLLEQENETLDWHDYGTWDGDGNVEKIGFLVSPDHLKPGQSGHFSYYLEANTILPRGDLSPLQVYSRAEAEISDSENIVTQSSKVCNTLFDDSSSFSNDPDNNQVIRFQLFNPELFAASQNVLVRHSDDDHYIDNDFYFVKETEEFHVKLDAISARIELVEANMHRSVIDIIGPESSHYPIMVRTEKGKDSFHWMFAETGANTGIFRSIIPLHASLIDEDFLRVKQDHCLDDVNSSVVPSGAGSGFSALSDLVSGITALVNFNADFLQGTTAENCEIKSETDDVLYLDVMRRGSAKIILDTTAKISPEFTVFDTTTFKPVENVDVHFYQTTNGSAPDAKVRAPNVDNYKAPIASVRTNENGIALYPKLTKSDNEYYFISVDPPTGFTWPSNYTDINTFNIFNVKPESYGPFGNENIADSGIFEIRGRTLVNQFDIPIDPGIVDRKLTLSKTADKKTAEVGSFVKYTIIVNNTLPDGSLYNAKIIDKIPYGFKYIEGSARLNEVKIDDPIANENKDTYTFSIGELKGVNFEPTYGVYTLDYVLQLSAGAIDSDGINYAYAEASSMAGGGLITSNVDNYQIIPSQTGVMSDSGIIFGRVFINAKCNKLMKSDIWPIGGVKIYLETGDYVITDENGQYSMFGINPGNHVLKVDRETLPDDIELSVNGSRNAGVPFSQFIDLMGGEMHKADFVSPCPTDNQEEIYEELKKRNENINGDWLFEEQIKSNGNKKTTSKKVNTSDLVSGVVSGPKNKGDNKNESVSKLSSFKGYALQTFEGNQIEAENFINKLPRNIKKKSYIYPVSNDVVGVRIGFSHNQENLINLRQKLIENNIENKPKETLYDRILDDDKLNIDNLIEDKVPLPQEEVKTITQSEAKEGTWYWPKGEYSYDGRFIVVIRGDVNPSLYINGDLVDDTQLGERIINKKERAQILAWYGVELTDGTNLAQIKTMDSFGNERILLEKEFRHPKSAKNIELILDETSLQADGGRSAIPITLKLTDEFGNLARGIYFVTLNNDMGLPWLEPDIQASINGHQVRVINGVKTIYLRSSNESGKIKVKAELNALEDVVDIYQVAASRPLFVNGILSYTGKYGKFSGLVPSSQKEGFENQHYSDDERAAIFMKGNIKGDLHLTLSYDSAKEDVALQREISPDSYYPAPGDASIRGYDARSDSKLFVKLERDRSYAMWGDFSTSDGVYEYDLARTSQILNGFSGVFDKGPVRLQLYASQAEDLHKVEEVPGNGTAMDYTLTDGRLVRHSDIVSLITYSRDNPGLIIKETSLKRYFDYTIDYFTGAIRFNRVIPMFDEDFNPVKIRIAYDLDGDGEKYEVAGTRGFYKFNSYFDSGFSYEYNSSDSTGYHLGGIWVNYNINNKTEIKASVASLSHDRLSEDEMLGSISSIDETKKVSNAMAYKLKLKRDWSPGSFSELEYSYADDDFSNSAAPVVAGRQEFKLLHRQKLSGLMNLNINASHSEKLSTKDYQQSVAVNIDSKILGSKWTTTLGSRYIKNKTEEQTESYTTAILGLGRTFDLFNKPGRIDSEYERSFGHKSKQRFNIKADWQLHKQASVYSQYEYIDSLTGINNLGSGTTSQFTAGIDIDWLHGGSTFNEFRQRGVSNGKMMELANGYRGQFEVIPGISVDPSVEYVEVLKGDKESGFAVSLGVADIRNPNFKTTGRMEFRRGDQENYYGFLGAWITRLNQDWSGLVREEYRYVDKKETKNTWDNHLSIAAAYRPRLKNNYHLLTSYEWKVEDNENKREAHIFSAHQNLEWSNDWILSGRLGVKLEDFSYYDDYYNSVSTILDARLIYNFSTRWDFDVHGGILGTDWFDSRRYSVGIGANYIIYRNIRLGVGYNFMGFADSDLDPQGYNLDGFYFDIMFALDESLFGWLSE
ncbi:MULTISPECIES: DUF11 domain-containing protein [unclassified Photobacterium]|uniref:DUF11 domain-containing protein n=1 Tax=unclassified Photobacterium TaxID=2628852 RepID=UPI000D152FD1|nr:MULTISPECIES: DUF11 domain-containing protein [unclassified Photobacterium]PSV27721.1 hypothetical protein C9J42_04995 [Photobacterium sp. GB-56]PSV31372.1 hypothetical protein C9J40_07925 [Photobacterium sp. GB-72]PSV35067.1 hypothetical protein C9J44_13780 [Photobacterium sp. GB-27]PSV38574.1 hypothetical protein C9J38_08860 [Photobacterium sp. GB-210]PSV45919.1 hypothetical protein C9J46_05240 [Photobacterium sp. GB-36]